MKVSRILVYLWPSVTAALVAVVSVGLVEGLVHTDTLLQAMVATGFIAVLGVPAGVMIALVARGLGRAWQLGDIAAAATEDHGGAPRLAAWTSYLLLGCWGLGALSFNTIRLLFAATSARVVIALAAALVVSGSAAGFVVLSRPVVRALTVVYRAVDRRIHRQIGRTLLSPGWLLGYTITAVVAVLAGAWLISVRPRIGDFDISFAYYIIAYAVTLLGIHVLWPLLVRRRWIGRGITVAAVLATVAVMASAAYARYARPYAMLEVWGRTQIAGGAVDIIYDLETLRASLDLKEFRPREIAGAAHPDIVIVTVDTMRADRTPPYGGRPIMPALAELAKHGTVFEWAFAPGNVTRRSMPSMMLGLSPERVYGRVAGWALRLDPRHVTLAERLRAAGYDTAGFFCCESQFAPRHRLGLIRGVNHLVIERKGEDLAEAARRWLHERNQLGKRAPVLVWLHFIEPHLWEKEVDPKIKSSDLKQRYDLSLLPVDRAIKILSTAFLSEERKANTIMVVTSDHGEGLNDHGFRTHATSLYNAQTRVPLVIVGPEIPSQRIQQPFGLIDLTPTLLELAGFEPPGMPHMDGTSAAGLVRGNVKDAREDGEAYTVMMADRSVRTSARALVVGRYKYIEHGDGERLELYDIVADPDEKKNLVESKREVLRQMQARMHERRQIDAVPPY